MLRSVLESFLNHAKSLTPSTSLRQVRPRSPQALDVLIRCADWTQGMPTIENEHALERRDRRSSAQRSTTLRHALLLRSPSTEELQKSLESGPVSNRNLHSPPVPFKRKRFTTEKPPCALGTKTIQTKTIAISNLNLVKMFMTSENHVDTTNEHHCLSIQQKIFA